MDGSPDDWVAVAAIEGEKIVIEPAQEFVIDPNQTKLWHGQLLEGTTGVLGKPPKAKQAPTIHVKTPHAKVGNLGQWRHWFEPMAEALENDPP